MIFVKDSSHDNFILMKKAIANALSSGLKFINVAKAVINSEESSEKDNPIDAYLEAKTGGWSAHLVPYGKD
jgi:hypothetical protein